MCYTDALEPKATLKGYQFFKRCVGRCEVPLRAQRILVELEQVMMRVLRELSA